MTYRKELWNKINDLAEEATANEYYGIAGLLHSICAVMLTNNETGLAAHILPWLENYGVEVLEAVMKTVPEGDKQWN